MAKKIKTTTAPGVEMDLLVLCCFANILHDIGCKEDHDIGDKCGWEYENINGCPWDGPAHTVYLTNASVLARTSEISEVDLTAMVKAWEVVEKSRNKLLGMLNEIQATAAESIRFTV